MYEWLELELSEIKTPKFHMVDGPADAKLREVVLQSKFGLPSSYKEFVLKFGNAKLYRNSRDGSYRVGVFAGPREARVNAEIQLYHVGFNDGASVYVKSIQGALGSAIFEFEADSEEKVADDFEEWLTVSCTRARNSYGKKKWKEILRGPKPFTTEEEEIVEARRNLHWKVLGVSPNGDFLLQITNASRRTLPVLTLGVRSKDGRLNGAIRLNTKHVKPGETATLQADCYKKFILPQGIEIFALPDPGPEDREQYHEFGPR